MYQLYVPVQEIVHREKYNISLCNTPCPRIPNLGSLLITTSHQWCALLVRSSWRFKSLIPNLALDFLAGARGFVHAASITMRSSSETAEDVLIAIPCSNRCTAERAWVVWNRPVRAEQRSGCTIVEHTQNILSLFHKSEHFDARIQNKLCYFKISTQLYNTLILPWSPWPILSPTCLHKYNQVFCLIIWKVLLG